MQAVLNLLKNSIEAIDINSGEKNITIKAYAEDGQLVIEVKDTGNGFDTTIGRKLFTRGFTTKPTGSGRPLPVALVVNPRVNSFFPMIVSNPLPVSFTSMTSWPSCV